MSFEESNTSAEGNADLAGQAQFGVGEFPQALNRFSWGAFFLPFFWGVAYRSWPVLTAWVLGTTAPFVIASMVGIGGDSPLVTTLITAEVLSEVVAGIARLWAGANAHRLLWRRDAFMVEMGLPTRMSVDRFISRQRRWTIAGAVVLGIVAVAMVPLSMDVWRDYGLTYVGAAMPVVWLVVEIGLAWWLDRGMRREEVPDGRRY